MCRFSNSVDRSFKVKAPNKDADRFVDSVLSIVKKYKIDLVIPILEEILYLARARERFEGFTTLFCDDYEKILRLHNKWKFNSLIREHGFLIPESKLLEDDFQNTLSSVPFPYILKESYSRASQGVYQVFGQKDLKNVSFSKKNPLLLQEYIDGKKYCTYSICQKGKVVAHSVYPVRHSILDSSCLSFQPIEHPEIFKWVEKLVKQIGFTGQICFDFIEDSKKDLYAIECNPRATSGLHLLIDEENILDAFFQEETKTIFSRKKTLKQIGFGMMIYGWKSGGFKDFLQVLFSAKDVLFSKRDLKPFLLQPLLMIVYLLKCFKIRANLSQIFTRDFDFDGE